MNFILTNFETYQLSLQAAPGRISSTGDMWSADTTKAAFLGVTAHWIEVKEGRWVMRSEVIGLRSVSGDHGGENLGRYFVGVCDRIGMTSKVYIYNYAANTI